MKFRLYKNDENKYNNQVVELKNYLKFTLVNSIIGIVVGLSLVSIKFPEICNNLVVSLKYVSSIYLDKYKKLSKEDKDLYVANSYMKIVNNSSEFSKEIKEELIGVSYFLKDYGHLYDIDDLINLEVRLSTVECQEKESEIHGNVEIVASYEPNNNTILFSSISSFPHEVSHLIVGSSNRDYSNFVRESITSSIDMEYYDIDSYSKIMKNQVLLLGEILERENLIKTYISGEGLEDLISKCSSDNECRNLLSLFEKEFYLWKNKTTVSDKINYIKVNRDINIMLKDMWEKKYNKKINEDVIANVVYNSCFHDSRYELNSTLFYKDTFSFQYANKVDITMDVDDRDYVISEFSDYFNINIDNGSSKKR